MPRPVIAYVGPIGTPDENLAVLHRLGLRTNAPAPQPIYATTLDVFDTHTLHYQPMRDQPGHHFCDSCDDFMVFFMPRDANGRAHTEIPATMPADQFLVVFGRDSGGINNHYMMVIIPG